MEDHDYLFDSFEWIEHEDNPEIIEKIRKQYRDSGIIELLTELDHMENEPNENKSIQETKLITIKRLIAIKLGLFDNEHAEFLIDTLSGHVKENESQIEKVAKAHKTHRHEKDRAFSSVPV